MPPKSSPLDVLPCQLLKSCAHVFAPAIARLANLSRQTGTFPARYKTAQVLPLLKKAGLDSSLPANYRPIPNLSTVSKDCTGCPFSRELTARWLFWLLRSAARRRRPTSITYPRTEKTSTICDDDRLLRRCDDRSPTQQWQSAHSAAQ